MGIETAVAVGGLIIGAAGTAYSAKQQRDAAKKQSRAIASAGKEKQQVEVAMQNEQAVREKRSQIREARIKRAMVENTAAVSGQGTGSAAISGGQNVTGIAGKNMGAINTSLSFANLQGQAEQKMLNAQGMSTTPGAGAMIAGGIGSGLMNMGLQQTTKSIFKE